MENLKQLKKELEDKHCIFLTLEELKEIEQEKCLEDVKNGDFSLYEDEEDFEQSIRDYVDDMDLDGWDFFKSYFDYEAYVKDVKLEKSYLELLSGRVIEFH